MKLALVCPNYPPATFEGGISHYTRRLAEGLSERGHDVYAITSNEFTRPSVSNGIQGNIHTVSLGGPWNFATVQEIHRKALENHLEAVVLQFSPASFSPSFRLAWALAPFGCQKLTAFHTLWGKGADRILGLLTLWGSKKIIATNSEIMFLLEKYLPRLLKKTYWIPIGSNIPPPVTSQLGDQRSPPLISYFGMLYPGKGLDLILDCLHALKEEGSIFCFKFIGGGMRGHEKYEAAFRRRIAERNLQEQVEHLGLIPEEEVSSWLSRSRFVFLPYERGLSDRRGTLMAAIAHGKAILTSAPVVPIPYFQNGRNLCWPEENTVSGHVVLMKQLLADDVLVTRLQQGIKEISTSFAWDQIVSDYELVLQHP